MRPYLLIGSLLIYSQTAGAEQPSTINEDIAKGSYVKFGLTGGVALSMPFMTGWEIQKRTLYAATVAFMPYVSLHPKYWSTTRDMSREYCAARWVGKDHNDATKATILFVNDLANQKYEEIVRDVSTELGGSESTALAAGLVQLAIHANSNTAQAHVSANNSPPPLNTTVAPLTAALQQIANTLQQNALDFQNKIALSESEKESAERKIEEAQSAQRKLEKLPVGDAGYQRAQSTAQEARRAAQQAITQADAARGQAQLAANNLSHSSRQLLEGTEHLLQNTPGIPAPLQAELKTLSRGAQDIFSAILAAARAKESPIREVRRLAKKHSVSQNIIRATTDLIQRKRQAVTAEEKETVVTNEQLLIKTIRDTLWSEHRSVSCSGYHFGFWFGFSGTPSPASIRSRDENSEDYRYERRTIIPTLAAGISYSPVTHVSILAGLSYSVFEENKDNVTTLFHLMSPMIGLGGSIDILSAATKK